MKKRKAVSIILILSIVFFIGSPVYANDEICIYFNGEKIIFDVNPTIIDGRTMVPMRAIFETFGASVRYYDQSKQIVASKDDLIITLAVNSDRASISKNGTEKECALDAVPLIIDGRTLVPLRFIGEALGAQVDWNGINKTVDILCVDPEMSASETAAMMEPKSVIIIGYDSEDDPVSIGSGFFISSNGYIATCYHVIEGVEKAAAVTDTGEEYEIKTVVHADIEHDLVVLAIEKTGCSAVTFGDSNAIQTGDKVYTYSSPLGISNTITEGIVSNKKVILEDNEYIQYTASISSGSSGGTLTDVFGKVIGVISATFIEGQNMNLAIPVSYLTALISRPGLDQPFDEFQEENEVFRIIFEREPNDGMNSAQMIEDFIPVGGTIDAAYDVDYYRFEVTEAGEVYIGLWWMSEMLTASSLHTNNLYMSIYDYSGSIICSGNLIYVPHEEPGTGFYAIRAAAELAKGTYYIRITYNGSFQTYIGEDYVLYYIY